MSEKKRGERKTSRKESELVLREISGRMHFFDSSPGCYVFFFLRSVGQGRIGERRKKADFRAGNAGGKKNCTSGFGARETPTIRND